MDKKYITIRSRFMPINGPEVDELESLCRQNGINFQNVLYRTNGLDVQASGLQSLVTLLLSDSLIHEIAVGVAAGIASAAIWDATKKFFVALYHHMKRNNPMNIGRSKEISEIELQSSSARLKIESDQVTAETFNEAFDAFIKVSEATRCEDRPVIPIYVVINRDNNVVVMKQNDYIWKYIVPQKPTKEADDGQT